MTAKMRSMHFAIARRRTSMHCYRSSASRPTTPPRARSSNHSGTQLSISHRIWTHRSMHAVPRLRRLIAFGSLIPNPLSAS